MCLIDYDLDGGTSEFFKETIRTAKKEHRCCECKCFIQPGDRYQYAVGLYDGDFFSEKTCMPCSEIRKEFYCSSWYYQALWDDMKCVEEYITIACLDKLSPDAVDKLVQMLEWDLEEAHP